MNILKTIWTGLDWSVLTDTLFNLLPALLCVTLHELAHGLAALSMGDTTARERLAECIAAYKESVKGC